MLDQPKASLAERTWTCLRHDIDHRRAVDLERARRGDKEARSQLLEVADILLIFWRDRSAYRIRISPVFGRWGVRLFVMLEKARLVVACR